MTGRLGDGLPLDAGLCLECRHLRLAAGARSIFVRCALAATDRRFARYPPLPVRSCAGYERRRETPADPRADPGAGFDGGSQR